MGSISFLTSGSTSGPQSIEESLFQLENCSVIFMASWKRVPMDLHRAARASTDAMTHLDHIVNELLRARDTLKAQGLYSSSPLKSQLDALRGYMASPVTRAQQQALSAAGPGNGTLPTVGTAISLEKLLNKIKHRQHGVSNFRVDHNDKHVFVVSVDKPNNAPDSIVEFDVLDFCNHCGAMAPMI